MADRIQLRRDTAANWTSINPVLAQGELGIETDTRKLKVGDGSTAWSGLGYLIDTGDYLVHDDVDDVPVNGAADVPVSSNWAFDHAALTTAHGISAYGATLVDDADAATARTTLGLGNAAIKTFIGDAAPTGANQNDGLMTHEDKAKLDALPADIKAHIGDAAPTGANQNDGLMTHEDKAKLDALEAGGGGGAAIAMALIFGG